MSMERPWGVGGVSMDFQLVVHGGSRGVCGILLGVRGVSVKCRL